jgi:hypothetical protein
MRALKSGKRTRTPQRRQPTKEDFDQDEERAKNIETAKELDEEKLMELMEKTKRLRIATEHDDD